jgi:hypothetical protein
MNEIVYGIHGNDSVFFLDLIAAEKYLFDHYQEYITSKNQFIDYAEQMIWEDKIIICEGCGDKTLRDELDSDWVKAGCCDTWFCHIDCHT